MALEPIFQGSTRRCSTTQRHGSNTPSTPSQHIPQAQLNAALHSFSASSAAEWPEHVQHLTAWFAASHPVMAPYSRKRAPPFKAAVHAAALWHVLHTRLCRHPSLDNALDIVDTYFDTHTKMCVHSDVVQQHGQRHTIIPLRVGDVLYSAQSAIVPHMVHPCLYVGGGRVVHVTTSHTSIVHITRHTQDAPKWAPITLAPIDVFGVPTPSERRKRVFRALACIGEWPYHPLWNTCEHFVRAVCGVPRGRRVTSLSSAAPLYAVVVIAVWSLIMLGALQLWKRQLSRGQV